MTDPDPRPSRGGLHWIVLGVVGALALVPAIWIASGAGSPDPLASPDSGRRGATEGGGDPLAGPDPEVPAGDPLDVLFIGNSYTFYHDLPEQIRGLSHAAGQALRCDGVLVGGATLRDHWDGGAARRQIAAGPWDVVVLQGQSVEPVVQPEIFAGYAVRFCEAIREAGAKPLLFMTWPRRAGHEHYGMMPVHDPEEMAAAMERIFARVAESGDARIVPVGRAWMATRTTIPELHDDLYDGDGSHPSVAGSYLSACVFHRVLHEKSPEGLGYRPRELTEGMARRLQASAAGTPLD